MELFSKTFDGVITIIDFPVGDNKTERVAVDCKRLMLLAHKLTFPESDITLKDGQIYGRIYYDFFPHDFSSIESIFQAFFTAGKKACEVSYVMEEELINRFVNALKLMNLKYNMKIIPDSNPDKPLVKFYIEVIPKTKLPTYPSITKFIKVCDRMDKMITIKGYTCEFKIHEFILDFVDVKYFSAMKNFKEGLSGIIEINDSDHCLESFYDFCYLEISEWRKKYIYSDHMIEFLSFADFLNCEKFFNTILSVLIEYHIQLRDILLEFQLSQTNNTYYQEIMKETPYDAKEYESMIIFRFKEIMRNREDTFEMFYMRGHIKYIHLFEHTEEETRGTVIFRFRIDKKNITVYLFNLFTPLSKRIKYVAFKNRKVIVESSLIQLTESYVNNFFKDGTNIHMIENYQSTEEEFIHMFIPDKICLPYSIEYFYTESNSKGDIKKIHFLESKSFIKENPYCIEYLGANESSLYYRFVMEEINLYIELWCGKVVSYVGYDRYDGSRCKSSETLEKLKEIFYNEMEKCPNDYYYSSEERIQKIYK